MLREGHEGPHAALTPKSEGQLAQSGCTSKSRYGSEAFANMIAADVFRKRGVALRAYLCTLCGGWHLTRSHAPVPESHAGWRPPAPSRRERAASDRRLHRRGKRKDRRWK